MHFWHIWILYIFYIQYIFSLRFYFIYILSVLLMFFYELQIIRSIQENITLKNALTTHTHAHIHETRMHMRTCTAHVYSVCLFIWFLSIILCCVGRWCMFISIWMLWHVQTCMAGPFFYSHNMCYAILYITYTYICNTGYGYKKQFLILKIDRRHFVSSHRFIWYCAFVRRRYRSNSCFHNVNFFISDRDKNYYLF